MTVNVASYIRVSTDEQAEQGISLAAQKNRIAAYCQAQNWTLSVCYCDDGWSGKDLSRPAMQKLIDDARAGKFDHLVVIKLDRLSRRQKDVLYLLEDVFESNKIGFKSVTEPFDTTTPFGKAAIGMMAVFAQLERETIVERIKMAKKEAARQGLYLGGPLPYGYQYDRASKNIRIDEEAAAAVRLIFKEYLRDGGGYQHIATLLNEKNIPPPGITSEKWQRQSIRVILHNPFYAGFIKYEHDLNKGNHPSIIEPDVFFAAQKLQNSRSAYQPNARSSLFAGMMYCGECGARMRLKKASTGASSPEKKLSYYVCYSQDGSTQAMIKDRSCKCGYKRAEILEQAIIEAISRRILRADKIKEAAAHFLAARNDPSIEERLTKIIKEYDGLEIKRNKWYQSFEDGYISAELLANRMEELRERAHRLEAERTQTQMELGAARGNRCTAEDLAQIMNDFPKIWGAATPKERRALIGGLIREIHINKDNHILLKLS